MQQKSFSWQKNSIFYLHKTFLQSTYEYLFQPLSSWPTAGCSSIMNWGLLIYIQATTLKLHTDEVNSEMN